MIYSTVIPKNIYCDATDLRASEMQVTAAVVREASGPFELESLELCDPRADEVLVRIVGAGICHTDLICRDQEYPVPLPIVLGHEGSGVVEAVGSDVAGLAPGDHVVLSFNSCGNCGNCGRGLLTRCDHLFERNFSGARPDGSNALGSETSSINGHFFSQSSFSTYAIANVRNAIKVDDAAPLELLGPLGCGIQTGAGAVMNTLHPRAGSSIAIFGCGSVGLSAVMAAKAVGCGTIIAVEPNSARRELAKQLGATHSIDPETENPTEKIGQLCGGGAEYSVECTGNPNVFRQAVDCLSVSGTCALVGAAAMGTEVRLDMNSIMFGRTVVGVIEGDSIPDQFIPKLVDLFQQGRFPIDQLITFYPLADIQSAVTDMENGKVIKPVLRP